MKKIKILNAKKHLTKKEEIEFQKEFKKFLYWHKIYNYSNIIIQNIYHEKRHVIIDFIYDNDKYKELFSSSIIK